MGRGRRQPEPPLEYRILLTATLCLLAAGAVMVYSASSARTLLQGQGDGTAYLVKYLVFGAAGLVLLQLLARGGLELLPRVTPALLAVSFVLLMIVKLPGIGVEINGARRWIGFGPASFQPSELAKLALAVWAASYLSRRKPPRTLGELVRPVGILAGLFCLLILAEPDLGTAIAVVVMLAGVLLVAGTRLATLGVAGAVALVLGLAAIWAEPYRRARFLSFLNPWDDPQGAGFQVVQSLLAVGSGGVNGLGFAQGRQKLFFLPFAHSDFIFAVVGEELGLVGALLLVGGFALFLWRGVRAARRAPDRFGMLLGLGIVTGVVAQALFNMSVVLSLVPTKGIPLPFISYGGSSLVPTLFAVGVLLNISQHASYGDAARVSFFESGDAARRSSTARPRPSGASTLRALLERGAERG